MVEACPDPFVKLTLTLSNATPLDGSLYSQAIALLCTCLSALRSAADTSWLVSMMTAGAGFPAVARMLRLVCAIVAALPGENTPITNVGTDGVPPAPFGPLSSVAIPAGSAGVQAAGGKPGMKPPGRPSVTSTIATRCVGMAAMRA